MILVLSMLSDLDRYYTPEHVARQALEHVDLLRAPISCADSTCGAGNLLHAANDVFGRLQCIGIDRDRNAIATLRRRQPDWTLATGDLLSRQAYARTFSSLIPRKVDLLIMNPPFSQHGKKSVEITYEDATLKGSVAMAYIMRSFELFRPKQGAVLIVPESLLYSQIDAAARDVLSKKFSLRKIADLENSTFHGARAHACVVQVDRNKKEVSTGESNIVETSLQVQLTRGGLPVHMMKPERRGIPYVHSTEIRKIVEEHKASTLLRTANLDRGRVKGWLLLIPRVGVPDPSLVRAVKIDNPIRLSDCVIALQCSTRSTAIQVENRIKSSWTDFRELYKGTGARYITLARLRTWLATRAIYE
jgi:predicted RNA methylase